MTGRAFIDTNVWVYAVDESDLRKQALAQAVLEREARTGLVLSAQVLGEFYVTVTRKLAVPMAQGAALEAVQRMARHAVVGLDRRLVEAAIVSAHAWQVSYWDAMLISAARTAGADRLITEDLQDGRTIEGVSIISPFRDADATGGTS